MTSKHNRQQKRNQARTEKGIFESIKVSEEVKKQVDKDFQEIEKNIWGKWIKDSQGNPYCPICGGSKATHTEANCKPTGPF